MTETSLRIMAFHKKISRNMKLSKEIKLLAAVCLIFAVFYCVSSKELANIDKNQNILTNIVWLISVILLVGLYMKDSNCVKNINACELSIYELEMIDLNTKKETAKITGEILSDTVLNKQIEIPEEISSPRYYYVILIALDIMLRIYMMK